MHPVIRTLFFSYSSAMVVVRSRDVYSVGRVLPVPTGRRVVRASTILNELRVTSFPIKPGQPSYRKIRLFAASKSIEPQPGVPQGERKAYYAH